MHEDSVSLYEEFHCQVMQDTLFLRDQQIMDYSLLLMIIKIDELEDEDILTKF